MIGGLISSTLLTLVLVPTLYTMIENRKEKRKRTLARPVQQYPARSGTETLVEPVSST